MSGLANLEVRLRALMLASLAGDGKAYRELLKELSEVLKRYYQRRLSEGSGTVPDDLVQEALLAIHSRRMTYDPDRAFTAWAYAIARYKLVDHFRRTRQAVHVPIDDVAEFLASDDTPGSEAQDLARMLETLPERTRELIHKVKIEGASIADVAASTGMSESAVKVSIHRGLKSLMKKFGGRHDG